MISIRQKGDFSTLTNYLEKTKEAVKLGQLDHYGRKGVKALESTTPKDTGLTSKSWYYEITRENESVELALNNSNIQNGIPIAILIQYGHGTNNGGWVEGRDYINPAVQPIFNEVENKVWKEVTKV